MKTILYIFPLPKRPSPKLLYVTIQKANPQPLYYLNPTLLLFGYKIYKAKSENKAVILIIKGTIHEISHKYQYKDLGNNIYLIKDKNGS